MIVCNQWSAQTDLIEEYQDYLNQLPKSKSYHTSLDDIIYDYYRYNRYQPTLFTCYIHLECNRGPSPSCLDWSEICDGKVDCIDGGYDEEQCWQIEIHQFAIGQCILTSFFRDDPNNPDCLDQSDDIIIEPSSFVDISYTRSHRALNLNRIFLKSSCVGVRQDLLSQAMFSIKLSSISSECWTASKCVVNMPIREDNIC